MCATLYKLIRYSNRLTPIALDTADNKYIFYDEDGTKGKNIIKTHDHFIPIPAPDNVVYISGRRGAGKSTFCSMYMNMYYEHTGNRVFLISKHESDPSIEMPKRAIRIPIADVVGVSLDELSNSLIVFDDITDASLSTKESAELYKYIVDAIENSRHNNISILITSHMMADYKKTRPFLYESSALVFFPKNSNTSQIDKVLRGYYSMNSSQIQTLLSLKSRWVYVSTTGPKYVIADNIMYTYAYEGSRH